MDRLSVLIVEDSAADAELLLARLKKYRPASEARVVDNETDFVAALDPPPDLILSDYSLPRFSGLRALELAKKRGVDTPFILVSGTVGEEVAVAAIRAGADDYLLKDRLTRLGPAVERALDRKRIEGERRRTRVEMARLATIVENSNDAIISRTLDGIVTSWNGGAERLFGYSAGEAIGQPISPLILPSEVRPRVAQNVEAVRRGEVVPPYETQRRNKDGRLIHVLSSVSPVRNEAGEVTGASIILRDISGLKQAEERANYLARYDSLTGLPNRNVFRDRLELAFAAAGRRNELLGVLVANLDRFKEVNESLGTEAGDELLRAVASRLRNWLREGDTIARVGGNEFALLVEGVASADEVTAVAEKLIELLAEPFHVREREIFVSASLGVAVYPRSAGDVHTLLQSAEIAMARVKQEGGGNYQVFYTRPDPLRGKRLDFECRLRRALANGEFAVHYQPKVSLLNGAVTGAEALLRWNNPELGQVSPALFIPLAEETGQIITIGTWILEAACVQTARWRGQGHDLNLAVNLSPRQFRQKNLAGTVAGILARSGLPAESLELEITEGTAMSNAEQTVEVLGELKRLGVKLAVDDFGTGYSSLNYLRRFPLHCLKIDGSFLRDVATDPHNEAIVRATIALAHNLKLKAIAEGVETEAQRDFLSRAGCDEYQGYYFSRPLPVGKFSELLGGLPAPGSQLPLSPA